MCVSALAPVEVRGQLMEIGFFLPTLWIMAIKLRYTGLVAITFTLHDQVLTFLGEGGI